MIISDRTVVTEQVRASDRDHIVCDCQHDVPLVQRKPGALRNDAPLADLPDSLQRLRQARIRHPDGDRVMAQGLATVPAYGLEAVRTTIDLVLQSGRPNAEHVVVARVARRNGTVGWIPMISTITNQGLVRFALHEGSINTDRLIDFMDRFVNDAEGRKVFLILDNLRVHHALAVEEWLAERTAQIEVFCRRTRPTPTPTNIWTGI